MSRPNIIVLTGGLSGSSVLTGLLVRAGLWPGDTTARVAYETWENEELVRLNRQIITLAGHDWENNTGPALGPSIQRISEVARFSELAEYRDFLDRCGREAPWIWKDPRLCYTMHFWEQLMDLSDIGFILVDRDIRQVWTGQVLRAKSVRNFQRLRAEQEACIAHATSFCESRGLRNIALTFEDLTVRPEEAISRINDFTGLSLTLDDLRAVYNGPLYRPRWTTADRLKAVAKAGLVTVLRPVRGGGAAVSPR